MAKFEPKVQAKVHKALHEFKEGELKTSHGKKVVDRSQAIAIGISQAEESGLKIPRRKRIR